MSGRDVLKMKIIFLILLLSISPITQKEVLIEPPFAHRLNWTVLNGNVFITEYDLKGNDDKADFFSMRMIKDSYASSPECYPFREIEKGFILLNNNWIYKIPKEPFRCKTLNSEEWLPCIGQ